MIAIRPRIRTNHTIPMQIYIFFSNMLALFLRMRKKTTRALACVVCRWANQRGVTLQLKTHYRVATFFFSVIVVVDLSLRNRRKKHAKEH